MLKLELEKENFKKYNNEQGYIITVDTSNSNKVFRVFREESENQKYLPDIMVEKKEEGSFDFTINNWVNIDEKDIDMAIVELEKYLNGYKIAKESITEFKDCIKII